MPAYRIPEKDPFASGKFVQWVLKTFHAKLTAIARQERVSLNTLVLTFIAEGVGMREEKCNSKRNQRGTSGEVWIARGGTM